MGFPRANKQDTFWQIVGDMQWKLDDGSRGPTPPEEPEFDHSGGGGGVSRWATHVIAFLLGGVTCAILVMAPHLIPELAIGAFAGLVTYTYLRRKAYRRP